MHVDAPLARAGDRPAVLQIAPFPAVPQGGIAAYAGDLVRSRVAERFVLPRLDVSVPRAARRWRLLRPLATLRFSARLGVALARDAPALVHIHTTDHAGFWEKAYLAALVRAWHRPYLLHLHGGRFEPFLRDLRPPWSALAARALAGAARVVVLGDGFRALAGRFVPSERVVVLPNAVHVEAFAPARRRTSGPRPRFLFLGMISARKGLDDLLAALLDLGGAGGLGFDVDIVGDEEERGALQRYRRLYRQNGLDPWVRFHGPAYGDAKLEFLRSADAFVLPTRLESFGIANLEAMAAGLPVLSTRTGAIPEYLQDGVHGLLVEPGDVGALGAALARLAADADLRRRLGAAALERARDYDWDRVAARVADLYEDVLATVAGGAGSGRR